MDQERSRFVTPIYEKMPREQLAAAFAQAYQLADEHGGEGLLVTFTTKANLDNIADVLRPLLGAQGIKTLKATSRLEGKTPIQMVTDRTFGSLSGWNGPALLVYPTKVMLTKIGDTHGITAEIVAPFTMRDYIRTWAESFSPKPILGAEVSPPPPKPAQAIQRGLEQIYHNNGLVTQSEREEAIRTFETIIAFAPGFTADQLHAWLLGHLGWGSEEASEARKIFEDLLAGKNIRGRSGPSKELWDYWSSASES